MVLQGPLSSQNNIEKEKQKKKKEKKEDSHWVPILPQSYINLKKQWCKYMHICKPVE
jgi:hypothetical protein